MLIFHKSKINSTIKDMSTLSYQHNNLNKDGCMEMDSKVPGFMGRVYLNKSLFSQAFIDKVNEAKKSGKTDNINVWWASRPIDLDWETLVKDVTELNPSCEEIVSNAAKKNNLFFSLSSLDKPITSGGTNSPITDLHVDDHVNKSSIKTDDKYSFQESCYVFANFSDWTSGTSSKPSFPKKLTISKICNNKSVDVDEQERKILVNYIQNFSEQWKCKTIIFESGKSSYGYDDNGKKEASSLTGAFPDVPGVCPTPKQKSVIKEAPKKPSKATDITAAMESKQKLEPPVSDSGEEGEEDETDEKKADAKPDSTAAKKTEAKPVPAVKKAEAKPDSTAKKTEVKPVPAVKKAEAKPDSTAAKKTEVKPVPAVKKAEAKKADAKPGPVVKKTESKPVPVVKKTESKPVVKKPVVKPLPAKKVGKVRVKTPKKKKGSKNKTKKKGRR